MPVITAQNVAKRFRRRPVLHGVDLTIEQGLVYGLVGPNGSGKSVLLRLLSGLIPPDEGTVTIDPVFLSADGAFPEKFGLIIDRPGFIPTRTGFKNLAFLASLRDVIGESRIREVLGQVGLDPDNPEKVSRYSLGMRQRLALAQAIMEEQTVLILDEPFNAMDTSGVEIVRSVITSAREAGRTVVFTTHDQREIEALSDVQLTIEGGTVTRSR